VAPLPRAQPAPTGFGDGPPRLVLRFTVSICIALALAAGAILLVVRHYNTVQAERAATSQARVIAGTVLSGSLLPSDFDRPVLAARRLELDRLFETHVLEQGVLLVTLYGVNGRVTYSTDHRLVGTRAERLDHIREALAGTIRGDVTTVRAGGADDADLRVLRTYAPVALRGSTGAVAIFQDYEPIARAAQATFLPIAGVFEAVLLALFVVLVPILRRVTRRIRRQMDEIAHRALHDDLTGLPNRVLFRDRVELALLAARRAGGSAVALVLDVDRFKEVNDALGHETGDVLLRELGARLREDRRGGETLARLGGDEFGILLPTATLEEAAVVSARVHSLLEQAFVLRDFPVEVAASIGIAAYPEHGADVDTLLQHADVAMYVAKQAHAQTAVYDAEQDTNDAARLGLAGELRRAIDDKELVVHFQPKAELASGQIVGAEALVRWEHPERGFVPPNEFVPIAERIGLIKPLTSYVLMSALKQCAEWNASGLELHVAVNLTIPDLLDLELPGRIAAMLAETGVRPEQLELEITESTILADPFRVRQVLDDLNEMGLRLAIDDFGTGYSSLAYLKRLPVQTIKVDRSFVMGMCENASDATIVRSTIDLGRNLGLEVVAEGVESQEVWNVLRTHGCSLAQGYLIARPLPADELLELLQQRTRHIGAGSMAASGARG
jgi:diguanylate cyclase (GGDEF)-like protein